MESKLPPLNALKVFEVAARQLSFSLAAQELNVTQGAVSKQIKLLEEYLELALFDRSNGRLQLTPAGQLYLPTIMTALDQIQSSTSRLQQFSSNTQQLTIDVTPSFSTLWLIPRLAHLEQLLPDTKVNILTGDGNVQFHQASADVAIRCLPLSLTHESATLLKEENMLPLIHTELLHSQPIKRKEDILNFPLLVHTTRPQLWDQFINSQIAHIDSVIQPKFSHGFEHFYMSIEAAKHKQGIALVPDFLAQNELASGKLVNPFDISYPSGYGFYFLTPSYRYSNPSIQTLFEWFTQQLVV